MSDWQLNKRELDNYLTQNDEDNLLNHVSSNAPVTDTPCGDDSCSFPHCGYPACMPEDYDDDLEALRAAWEKYQVDFTHAYPTIKYEAFEAGFRAGLKYDRSK